VKSHQGEKEQEKGGEGGPRSRDGGSKNLRTGSTAVAEKKPPLVSGKSETTGASRPTKISCY